jgi:hypothetical protein
MSQPHAADGSKKLFRDSKIGNIVNGAAVAAALYIANAVSGLDVTALPDALEPVAFGLIGTVVGLLTSWATARRKDNGTV